MAVYRLDLKYAQQLTQELLRMGVTAEVEQYGPVAYLVVDTKEVKIHNLVRGRVPKAVSVPGLDELH